MTPRGPTAKIGRMDTPEGSFPERLGKFAIKRRLGSGATSHVFQAFDPFTVVDLRAQYRFSETATANFGIDNVGNAKYTLFHPFPQRTYVADVRIKF